MKTLTIEPLQGISPYNLGMDKDELCNASRSPIFSYFAQQWDTIRCDEFTLDKVTVHYDSITKRANFISVGFDLKTNQQRNIILFNEIVNDFVFGDVIVLLNLHGIDYNIEDNIIVAKNQGLIFGFKDNDNSIDRFIIDFINITMN